MSLLLRSTVLFSVMFASLFAGMRTSLVLASAGQDVDCGMSCCMPEEAASSCCASDEPEVVMVSPCGCEESAPDAILELNRIDWAPAVATADGGPEPGGASRGLAALQPPSRVPAPEKQPPRV